MKSGICIYLKVYKKVCTNQALIMVIDQSYGLAFCIYTWICMCYMCICICLKVHKFRKTWNLLSMWRRVIDQSFGLTSSNLVCFNLTSEQRRETFWIFQAEHNTKTYRDEKWYRQSFQKIYSKLLYFHIS